MPRTKPSLWLPISVALALVSASGAGAQTQPSSEESLRLWLDEVQRLVSRAPAEFGALDTGALARGAEAVDAWAHRVSFYGTWPSSSEALEMARQMLAAKQRVDELLSQTLALRGEFAALPAGDQRCATICNYLRACAQLIDLSGRLRYQQEDAFNFVLAGFVRQPPTLEEFLDLLIEYRSSIGANVLAGPVLAAPPGAQPGDVPRLATPITAAARSKALRLIAVSGQAPLLANVAEFLKRPDATPSLVLEAAETIRAVGLPQDVRPGTPSDLPLPAITAATLAARLQTLDASRLSADQARRHSELLAWLAVRRAEGVTEPGYRLGTFDVQPGDWLLMRNPSPYNLFTDLSPGLFTHVGVVTAETGGDGLRRIVLVDLQERGTRMPATNVEIYVQRSLNYVFLRHPEPAVARAMAEAARSVIGNESEFDLNFRTSRITELQGQPLAGRKIKTYCAGLLLLCALQSTEPREAFFPLTEGAAGGLTRENLTRLGMTIGADFISPTGALFSPKLLLVGRREPMYDPRREVEEAIFDHFATRMIDKPLTPAPDLFNALRLKLAQASRQNPLLAEALARAAGVNAQMDLVSAAKAAAVVETLDEIAFGTSAEFLDARAAILAPPPAELREQGATRTELERIDMFRRRHPELSAALVQGQLSPRQLRTALVKYYIESGKREIDRRFFGG